MTIVENMKRRDRSERKSWSAPSLQTVNVEATEAGTLAVSEVALPVSGS